MGVLCVFEKWVEEEIVDMWRVYVKLKNVEWWKTGSSYQKKNLVMDSVLLKLFSLLNMEHMI